MRKVCDSTYMKYALLLPAYYTAAPDTMYMYEGKDYSKSSEPDRKTFDQLLAGISHTYNIHACLYIYTHIDTNTHAILLL